MSTMKDCHWKSFLVFAVLQSAVAFKIPGLSTGSRTPPSGKGPGNRGPDGEYTGPVFIMRELNKEKGEYDAFITTGGIQEVRPAQGGRAPPHGHQKPAAVRGDAEDAEYFGMLVTPETVRALDHPSAAAVNVSLSTLLVAASSRMPWLLVLRRADYPQLFEHQHQPAAAAVPSAPPAVVPGMQIPQRRRYYAADGGRQRRGLYPAPYGQRAAAAADDYDDYEPGRTFPPAFERQLLSTMCYNFVRDYTSAGDLPRLPIALAEPEDRDRDERGPVIIDADAYAAAAFRDAPPAAPATSPPDGQQQQQQSPVQMTVPKRVPS